MGMNDMQQPWYMYKAEPKSKELDDSPWQAEADRQTQIRLSASSHSMSPRDSSGNRVKMHWGGK